MLFQAGARDLHCRTQPGAGRKGRALRGEGEPPRARAGSEKLPHGRARRPCARSLLSSQRSPPGPSFQSSLRCPGGSARNSLAMSQPGRKPAASPRPRRAAASRQAQEVSGALAEDAGWPPGGPGLRSLGLPPLGVACLARSPVCPIPG